MEQQALPNLKKILFNAYQNIYLSNEAAANHIPDLVQKQPPPG